MARSDGSNESMLMPDCRSPTMAKVPPSRPTKSVSGTSRNENDAATIPWASTRATIRASNARPLSRNGPGIPRATSTA